MKKLDNLSDGKSIIQICRFMMKKKIDRGTLDNGTFLLSHTPFTTSTFKVYFIGKNGLELLYNFSVLV